MPTKTFTPQPKHIRRHWHLIDLEDQVLGRTATNISILLQGKNKPYYSPHLDCGDYVVVVNAAKVKVTGRKPDDKIYFRHSGYPGGVKEISFNELIKKDARKVIHLAVKGMLPKNKLRSPRLRRLKVFSDGKHTYADKFVKVKSTSVKN